MEGYLKIIAGDLGSFICLAVAGVLFVVMAVRAFRGPIPKNDGTYDERIPPRSGY